MQQESNSSPLEHSRRGQDPQQQLTRSSTISSHLRRHSMEGSTLIRRHNSTGGAASTTTTTTTKHRKRPSLNLGLGISASSNNPSTVMSGPSSSGSINSLYSATSVSSNGSSANSLHSLTGDDASSVPAANNSNYYFPSNGSSQGINGSSIPEHDIIPENHIDDVDSEPSHTPRHHEDSAAPNTNGSHSGSGLSRTRSRPRSFQLAVEQERHIQEQLQRLARTENARLDAKRQQQHQQHHHHSASHSVDFFQAGAGKSRYDDTSSSRPTRRRPVSMFGSPQNFYHSPTHGRSASINTNTATFTTTTTTTTTTTNIYSTASNNSSSTSINKEEPFSPNPDENIFVISQADLQRLSLDDNFEDGDNSQQIKDRHRLSDNLDSSSSQSFSSSSSSATSSSSSSSSHTRTFSWQKTAAVIHSSAACLFSGKKTPIISIRDVPVDDLMEVLKADLLDPAFVKAMISKITISSISAIVLVVQILLLVIMALAYLVGDVIVGAPQRLYRSIMGTDDCNDSGTGTSGSFLLSASSASSSSSHAKSKKQMRRIARIAAHEKAATKRKKR